MQHVPELSYCNTLTVRHPFASVSILPVCLPWPKQKVQAHMACTSESNPPGNLRQNDRPGLCVYSAPFAADSSISPRDTSRGSRLGCRPRKFS